MKKKHGYKRTKYTDRDLMAGGGYRMPYNKGGYASIQEMEKSCGSKVSQNRMK